MTTYIEYGVTLTDGQKSKLASAIINQSPLTLRLKHSHLRGSDELMLTKRQIDKIKKSIANGTGSDIKISKTQIRKSVKHGGNLFSSLASIGAKVLPYAIKGISKAVPALATGAATALGEIGLNKIFGKGITIPPEFFPMLPKIVREFTKTQIYGYSFMFGEKTSRNKRVIGLTTFIPNRFTNGCGAFAARPHQRYISKTPNILS